MDRGIRKIHNRKALKSNIFWKQYWSLGSFEKTQVTLEWLNEYKFYSGAVLRIRF